LIKQQGGREIHVTEAGEFAETHLADALGGQGKPAKMGCLGSSQWMVEHLLF
jgi:hypothetical protein